ncbi:molybdopterin converting factor subunit 1 [Thermomonas flagellata]|uniref:molybdopterin converting factor subunit 1 n=1 Tax=Thermomonas flagellata TaxID=2888524 RepID=UPI001F03444F|nr:molybdopterin converting factor subunit 1 [Thermomonas flagellata]
MNLRVLYFASLRDAAGTEAEDVQTHAADLAALHDELQARHRWALPRARLRVAVDGRFAGWHEAPREGCTVAFIPPVSGG